MAMAISIIRTERAKINQYEPHPENARRGNHDVIKESLERFGQYKPVVVNEATGRIVAGNNVWAVMRNQGWTEYDASIIDVDEETELEILLVDNRASDLASYDDAILMANLHQIDEAGRIGWASLEEAENQIANTLRQVEEDTGYEVPPAPPASEIPEPPSTVDSSPPADNGGLGQPIVSYNIVFDDDDQKRVWTGYLRWLRDQYDNEQTTGARLAAHILDMGVNDDDDDS